MTRKKGTKIMAGITLFFIVLGIGSTGILIFLGNNTPVETEKLSPEELQKLIENSNISVEKNSNSTGTVTNEINKNN